MIERFNINTKETQKSECLNTNYFSSTTFNNNGFSFPSFSGRTVDFNFCNSGFYEEQNGKEKFYEESNFYSISLDWMEFICKTEELFDNKVLSFSSQEIIIKRVSNFRHPNFKKVYSVVYKGVSLCEIATEPSNKKHDSDEVSVKIDNYILYTTSYANVVAWIINYFGLEFKRCSRVDIALDGYDVLKIIDLCHRYIKSDCVQINNDGLTIEPKKFKKSEHRFLSWIIGSKNSGKLVEVYDKLEQLKEVNKNYIKELWKIRGLDISQGVGRFELRLYGSNIEQLGLEDVLAMNCPNRLSAVFQSEVKEWLIFYSVKAKHMKMHKKETALKKGHVTKFIHWSKLPKKQEVLRPAVNYVSNSTLSNAKKAVTFNLEQIIFRGSVGESRSEINVVRQYMRQFCLQQHVVNKLSNYFGDDELISKLQHAIFIEDEAYKF